jgi:hypothetical protein
MSRTRIIPCLLFSLALIGCANKAGGGKGHAATVPQAGSAETGSAAAQGDGAGSRASAEASPPTPQPGADTFRDRWVVRPEDPPMLLRPQVNLSVLQYSVPAGTVSASEEFWKRVDEQAVDVAKHDILYKNGLRVGRATLTDLDFFLNLMGKFDAQKRPEIFAATAGKSIELPMKKGMMGTLLYDIDDQEELTLRSYEDCDLFFNLEFAAAPRKSNEVRIGLVPVTRTLRKRFKPVGDGEAREVEYTADEKRFHLNLRADVAVDKFLIVAPSPEARSPMSIGNAFLTKDGATQRTEEVLILIPQAIRPRTDKDREIDAKATAARRAGGDSNQ